MPRHTAVWAGRLGIVALAALGFGGTACSRGEKPQPTGAPMGGSRARSADENRPPVIQRLTVDPSSPVSGDHVRALATAVDPDGDPVTLRYVWTVDGTTLSETGPEIAPEALAPGTRIEVEAVASDGRLESQPEQASVEVRGTPPQITTVELAPAPFVPPGDPVLAKVDLGDSADGVELHYQWFVNDDPAGQDADRFDTAGLHRGDRIAVSVTPARGDEQGDAVRSADIGVGNAPPKILSQPQGALGADGTFRYEVKAEDPDGDTTLRYRLDHAPQGMTIDPVLGVVTWRPTDAQLGRHEAEVVVSDGHGGETHQKIELTLSDSSGSSGDAASGSSGGTPAPASAGEKGGSGDEEAAAPAPAPVRYRRYGHRPGPAQPAAPAPAGAEDEGEE